MPLIVAGSGGNEISLSTEAHSGIVTVSDAVEARNRCRLPPRLERKTFAMDAAVAAARHDTCERYARLTERRAIHLSAGG